MSNEQPHKFSSFTGVGNTDDGWRGQNDDGECGTLSGDSQASLLRDLGARQAQSWVAVTPKKFAKVLKPRWRKSSATLQRALSCLGGRSSEKQTITEEQRWILDNARFLCAVLQEVFEALRSMRMLPVVGRSKGQTEAAPRAYQLARGYLQATGFVLREETLGEYLTGVQRVLTLEMGEIWELKPLLQLVLLEQLGGVAEKILDPPERQKGREDCQQGVFSGDASKPIASLHAISRMIWKDFFEATSVVDHILRADPARVYPAMDFESRQLYRDAIADVAPHAKLGEVDIARQAVLCAQKAQERGRGSNSRALQRRSNVGYYLLDAGSAHLKKRAGYRPPWEKKLRDLILEWPEVYYVVGVELTTLALVYVLLRHLGAVIPLLPGLLLLIPASQAAIGLMNHLTAYVLRPRRLPKLDFSAGIPPECLTLVVVPCLLLSEREVRHIVESLEVRYLGNRDPNLHFALLTDSPDASRPRDENDSLVGLCSLLIDQLNKKHARDRRGGFFHFHRHRIFNPQENTWMGWERKRGKLLSLNRLLRGGFDGFPVKVGDLSILSRVRYVITLDSDTRLPRDTAQQLVGALAHPLNRAVIDRHTNTVVEGYGILQPRVGIGIESSRKSRLAGIYSGETGCDIYTRAVSDVYQDLFGEGSFTGKGIYEVDTFQRILGNRFPSNALLSHDLIEGAYARAGLVSDVEVIDDYPSHFSAYCRRMHRWVRGDWQILRWLFPRVPDFFGRRVPNPLTLLSRWKIFDNLRRSLFELNLFLLWVAGWFFFPGGAVYWTFVLLALLLMPTYIQLIFSLLRIKGVRNSKGFLKERANNFLAGHLQVFVMVAFLAHRAFVMLDAVIRTLLRLIVTHRNLLEWETATEAELGPRKKTAVEIYLALTPWFALGVGIALRIFRPGALFAASPVLGLWLLAGVLTKWINRPPRKRPNQLSRTDETFLRLATLRTWRFFREHSGEKMNGLVPDRVQEEPPAVVAKISPTNLGLLLNGRLAALGLGYLTLLEFIEESERTLRSAKRLTRSKGHFFNWYDVRTLEPLRPRFVSTVDSGNLAVCLWTLKQACLGMLKEPLMGPELWQGIRDHVALLLQQSEGGCVTAEGASAIEKLARSVESMGENSSTCVNSLPRLRSEIGEVVAALGVSGARPGSEFQEATNDLAWWASETLARIESLSELVQTLMPWLWPGFGFPQDVKSAERVTLKSLPSQARELKGLLDRLQPRKGEDNPSGKQGPLGLRLRAAVHEAAALSQRLQRLAGEADHLLRAMDFGFLFDAHKSLLSVGWDVEAQRLEPSCYDLLASEARMATFIAIAKGDIKQEAWFRLGRSQVREGGEALLISWSGTMFEYLMPLLWMKSYSGTMLDQAMRSAVVCQRRYARRKGVPWGISEAAFNAVDGEGIYQYRAFGLAGLALDPKASDDLVIAPYASFLALLADARSATDNLKRMREMGWLGRLGFYESADYSTSRTPGEAGHERVRCWMAHHQGMSLLAVCNLLRGSYLQHCFHQEPQVVATELLLHERVTLAGPEERNHIPRVKRLPERSGHGKAFPSMPGKRLRSSEAVLQAAPASGILKHASFARSIAEADPPPPQA